MTQLHTDLMLDIETLGTSPDAPVLTLAAVPFTDQGALGQAECFHLGVNLTAQMAAGAHADADTILWWLRQGKDAQASLLNRQATGVLPEVAAARLSSFLATYCTPDVKVWGNGAAFDPVVVAAMFRRHDQALPWRYTQVRCYRTLLALNPGIRTHRPAVAHDALQDAHAQARTAVMILQQKVTKEVFW